MLHTFKTPAALTACLVFVSACSSSANAPINLLTADAEASAAIEQSLALRASPVDLKTLAALANSRELGEPTFARASTAGISAGKIVPAASVSYKSNAPIQFDAEADYSSEALIVVPHDSDLLQGTVYDSEATQTMRKPDLVPGTYRTVEFKK